jgi:DNA-binding LacI/PurR family transcriptional regulator
LKRIGDFLTGAPPFDAVFAASDVLAIAAIQALTATGRRVPEDVSVVGYDNIGASALTVPGLTTVTQNIRIAGETMVDLLVRKISGESVRSRVVPTELIVRGSSLPPAGSRSARK